MREQCPPLGVSRWIELNTLSFDHGVGEGVDKCRNKTMPFPKLTQRAVDHQCLLETISVNCVLVRAASPRS